MPCIQTMSGACSWKATWAVWGLTLRPQANLADQLLKARVGSEGIEAGFDGEDHQRPVFFVVGFLQILEGPVFLVECGVNDREIVRGDEGVSGFFLQAVQHSLGFGLTAGGGK